MFERMWEAIETKAGKTGVAKIKRRRDKRRNRKEIRRENEKAEKRKNNESKESSKRMGNLG